MVNADINPVVIPEGIAISRAPNGNDNVDREGLTRFDKKTIFYDVFIDRSKAKLIAIGPPALNLADYVATMTLTVNGEQVAYDFKDLPEYKLSFLEVTLKPADVYALRFSFKDFTQELRLSSGKLPHGLRVLAAISKDNEIEWISDWVDFYRKNYSIDDVFVYDNGSRNVDELEAALEGRAHVIRWHFPYGPPKKRFNKFAQPGALNHCLLKYAKHGVLFNFDIDELLIADREKLDEELDSSGTLYVSSYNVPFVDPGKPRYSYYDFSHRRENIRTSARKFICKADAVDIISQHNTWVYKGRSFWKRLKRNKPEAKQSRDAYFLHFLGITTNWQPDLDKLMPASKDDLVFDDSHCLMKPAAAFDKRGARSCR